MSQDRMQIEFYQDKTGTLKKELYLKWVGIGWKKIDELTPLQIEMIFDVISNHPKIRAAFMHLAQFNDQFPSKKELLIQVILCNWTRLDNKLDIDDKRLQFEKVECPFKHSGKCPYKGIGIVCIKP